MDINNLSQRCVLTKYITQLKEARSDNMVNYFYFDFNVVKKQSSKKAIRSLLLQLTLQ